MTFQLLCWINRFDLSIRDNIFLVFSCLFTAFSREQGILIRLSQFDPTRLVRVVSEIDRLTCAREKPPLLPTPPPKAAEWEEEGNGEGLSF